MKKILLFLFISAFISSAGFAQDSTAHSKNAATKKQDKYQQLGLTKEQQQKMKQIKQDEKIKRAAIESNQSLSSEQKQEQLKQLKNSEKTQTNSVLTTDQKSKLKQMKAQKKKQPSQSTTPST